MVGVMNLWLYFNDNNENYIQLIIAISFMTIPTLIYYIYLRFICSFIIHLMLK